MNDHAVMQETMANRDLFARVLIGEIDAVVAPLLRLDERSRASIVALVGAAQLITAYERSAHHAHATLGTDFDAILYGLHADGAALLAGLRTSGLAESVAYGWTLALCRGEHEDEGASRAARAAAAEVACAMSHLDALLDVLRRLHLPSFVASDRPRRATPELVDFPQGWEPACRDMQHGSGKIVRLDDFAVYDAIGEEGFRRLVSAFYRQVPADDILGPMYPPDDLAGAEERLRDFLVGRFGGPARYVERRGHPRLRMRHTPFAVTAAARDRWVQLMTRALDEVALPPDADAVLRQFFDAVATMMINRP